MVVSSPRRFALVHELRGEAEFTLPELLRKLAPVDLVIVEGFKRYGHPKLEVYRAEVGKPFLHHGDPAIFAIASDQAVSSAGVPVLDLNDAETIAGAMLKHAMPLDDLLEQMAPAEIG